MPQTSVTPTTSVDLTCVGQKAIRNRIRSALEQLEPAVDESSDFWSRFFDEDHSGEDRTLVIGDLSRVVRHYLRADPSGWTRSVRRQVPYFLVLVRTESDRRLAGLVDDLFRASDMRVDVCDTVADWSAVVRCLSAGVRSLRPDALLEVRHVLGDRGLWLTFGDGFNGVLRWDSLGISPEEAGLIPESARVSDRGSAIEVATRDDDLFEIDAAAARGVLDPPFGETLKDEAEVHARSLGDRIRARRTALELNQTDLADRTGLDQAVISRIENGRVRPRIDTLRRLAEGLETSLAGLLAGPP